MAEVVRIDAETWRIEDGFVRFFVLSGTERALLVDTGATAPDARAIAESLTSLPLTLLNTHADPDHTSGNAAFEKACMSPDEEGNYRAHGGTCQIVPIREGDVIDLGERTLRVIDIPGHTPGSVALLDEKRRALFSGDSVQDGNIYMFGPFRNIGRYVESLRHLEGWQGRFDVVYPSHGSPEVEPSLIGRLLHGACQVMDGKVPGVPVELHGRKALLHKLGFAGLLCDAPDA